MLRVLPALVLFLAQALAQPLPAEIVDTDQAYGDHPRQLIDVAARPTDSLKPAVLLVPGGDWQAGDKRSAVAKSRFFLGQGFALAAINHRLYPEARPRQQAEDVAAAAVWLAKNADRYGIDPRQIYLAGHESGGHLVALVATDPSFLARHGATPADLGGVLLLDPSVFDVPTEANAMGKDTQWGRTLRLVFSEDPSSWPGQSPAYQTGKAEELPSFFVAYAAGRPDANRQAKPFIRALRQESAVAQPYEIVGNRGDAIFRSFGTRSDALTRAAVDFIRREANIPVARDTNKRVTEDLPMPWLFTYLAPEEDEAGYALGGTQISQIVTHDGRLFAGNAHPLSSAEMRRGQIFRLDAREDRWRLDHQMPRFYTRAASMLSTTFSKDSEGRPIEPLDYLLVGATYEPRPNRAAPAGIFMRTPSGNWTKQDLGDGLVDTASHVEALAAHTDGVTGLDMVFAAANPAPHGIYAGTYDPAAPGGIRFGDLPEFTAREGERLSGFARCGDTLFAATDRRLLSRTDGARPRWTVIADLQDMVALRPYLENLDIFWQRNWAVSSLRCDQSRAKPTLAFTALGRTLQFAPGDQAPSVETDLLGLIRAQLGREAHFVTTGEATTVRRRGRDLEEWVGLEVYYEPDYIASAPDFPYWPTGFGKEGLYLVRTVVGGQTSYRIEAIEIPGHDPYGRPLGKIMDFELSPFETDHAIYVGGFNPWFDEVQDTAWMARGEL